MHGVRKKRKSNKKGPLGAHDGQAIIRSILTLGKPSGGLPRASARGPKICAIREVELRRRRSTASAVPIHRMLPPHFGFASGHVRCGTTRHLRRQTPTCKSVRVRYLRRGSPISPTPSVVESGPAGGHWRVTRPLRHADQREGAFEDSKAPASTARYFDFFFDLRFAVLRAVFFAADFVFDFAFFAILPS